MKTLVLESLFNKVEGQVKFLRTPILKNIYERLLLYTKITVHLEICTIIDCIWIHFLIYIFIAYRKWQFTYSVDTSSHLMIKIDLSSFKILNILRSIFILKVCRCIHWICELPFRICNENVNYRTYSYTVDTRIRFKVNIDFSVQKQSLADVLQNRCF